MFRFSSWGRGGILGESMRNRHRYVCVYVYMYAYLFIVYFYYFKTPYSKVFIIVKLDLNSFVAFF